MPLPTKTITVSDPGGSEVTITVRQATLVDGMRRGRWIHELLYSTDVRVTDPDLANVYAIYCDLVGATVSVEGMEWPVPVDVFVEFSDRWFDHVGVHWLRAIHELNPNWQPGYGEADSGEAESAVE